MKNPDIFNFDVIVAGAGVIGIAISLAHVREGFNVLLVEKNNSYGHGISSRSSEVIHAGIYYPPSSFKAIFCRKGMELVYKYCQEKQIPHRKVGKLIVQTNPADEKKLNMIYENGLSNDCSELQLLNRKEINVLEPELEGKNAVWSPYTGILDSHSFMHSMINDFKNLGGTLALNHFLENVKSDEKGLYCELDSGEVIKAPKLINSTGLKAVEFARSIEGFPSDSLDNIGFCKGTYFGYKKKVPFSHLIYPVPSEAGLGTHYTLDLGGNGKFGPDTEWIKEENYSLDQRRIVSAHHEIIKYWPNCNINDITLDYCGIRPKLGNKGKFKTDFQIQTQKDHTIPGLINLLGIESPGLTSALAIADYIVHSEG